jgi:hypothetical protein
MMQKYQIVPKTTFCNFCKLIGHVDKDCRTFELMKERTSKTYRVQDELMIGKPAQQPQYNSAQQFPMQPEYNNTQQFRALSHYNNAQ